MSKYLDRLSQDKDAKALASAKLAEAHAKASVQGKIAGLTAKGATLDAAYEAALGANPFDVEAVVRIQKEQADNKATLDAFNSILSSEFSTTAAS